jgi:non-specific serine/threonine protein kinase/serine/threonine-protein kinase
MPENQGPPGEDNSTETYAGPASPLQTLGNYRLVHKIGEGGMGEVYRAEQLRPVRRVVALKLIKLGMDTRDVVARFESERQALALMNHPCIARVFDAGATAQGRPYFVMEYVQGVPITKYCDTHRLTVTERLELMIKVCEGVQHAHQKGIIHRDIKASNILIGFQDGKPTPKIIDFGVAKATDQRLSEHSLHTALGQMIGTPEFMSPEQAEMSGLDIDVRTDIYSLGVLLYLLLVGTFPFDRRDPGRSSLEQFRRRLREEEPPKPSARMSALGDAATAPAHARRMDVRTLRRALRGDLDWITMKALEKDRTRRYSSASELASDIASHLKHEPVSASPPGTAYRMGKFVRRHRVGVAATGFVLLALITGVIGTSIGMIRAIRAERGARQAEQQAERDAEAARRVSDFLVQLFKVSNPGEAQGNSVLARDLLDRGAAAIDRELAGRPLVQARLMAIMGEVYRNLGLYGNAQPLLERALQIRRDRLGTDHADVADSLEELGRLLQNTGRYEQARPLFEEALAIREAVSPRDDAAVVESLINLANLHRSKGETAPARTLYGRALALSDTTFAPDDPRLGDVLNSIAELMRRTGEYQAARPLYEKSLAIREKALGPEHPDVAASLNNLTILLTNLGEFQEARQLCDRALQIREKVLGPRHPDVAATLTNRAELYRWQEQYDEARPLYERALAIREAAFGRDHPDVASSLNNLAILMVQTGELENARILYEDSLAIRRRTLGEGHPDVAASMHNLAILLASMEEYERALSHYEQSRALWEKKYGPEHPNVASSLYSQALLMVGIGRYAEARPLYDRALAIRENTLSLNHTLVAQVYHSLGCLSALEGRREDALVSLRLALERGLRSDNVADEPALQSLRGDPEFEALVTEFKRTPATN